MSSGPLVVIHGGNAPAPSAVAPVRPAAHVRTSTRSREEYRMPLRHAVSHRGAGRRPEIPSETCVSFIALFSSRCEGATPWPVADVDPATGSLSLCVVVVRRADDRAVGAVGGRRPDLTLRRLDRTATAGATAEGVPGRVVRRVLAAGVGVTARGDPDGAALREMGGAAAARGSREGDLATAAVPVVDMAAPRDAREGEPGRAAMSVVVDTAAARSTREGDRERAAMSVVVDTAAARGTRIGDPEHAAVPVIGRTAARGSCGGVPEHAVMPVVGEAAVEFAQQDEPGSAATPVFRMAAARVAREDDP
jgi:hypothetical protein